MKLKIGAKITLGFALMLVLVLILGGNSLLSLKSSREQIEEIDMASQRLHLEMHIENIFSGAISAERGYIAYGDEKYYTRLEQDINKLLEEENQLLQIAGSDKKQEVQNIIRLTKNYQRILFNELLPVAKEYHNELRAGHVDQAGLLTDQMNVMALSLTSIEEQITKTLHDLVVENDKIADSIIAASGEDAAGYVTIALILTVIAALAGILLSIFFARMIRNPITQMVSGANKYAEGDFRDTLKIKSSDEIGELGLALNAMQKNFREIIEKLSQSSSLLSDSSEQLASQAQQTAAGASETSSTMGEIASTVDTMSQNTLEVSQQANLASEYAGKGHQGVEMVTGQMQDIAAATSQVNASINTLSEAIGKIGQFVEVITNIADQTNLLALNAAIEAARAGEAGRGFAVVAEEVRKLAEQSAQSTKEIKLLIEDIQVQSEQAVQVMSGGNEKVEQGNRIVSEVGSNFNQIIKAVQDLTNQIQNVAASAEQVSAGVQNVAATTEEQTAAMEEVSASTESLTQLAAELNGLVMKFKI